MHHRPKLLDFFNFCSLELRASELIKKGQEISNQYVKPDVGTVSRRLILRNKWHFLCDCSRCSDPSEFGSNLSALLCEDCKGGTVLPKNPLVPEDPWVCLSCESVMTVENVSEILLGAEEAFKDSRTEEDIVEHYER